MARRERAASTRRALRALGATSPTAVAALRAPATSGPPRQPPLQPPLESLFDSAPESWLALQCTPRDAGGKDAPRELPRLAAIACGFTSRVSLEPPDAVLLEVRGSFQLFGGAQSLCTQLLARCRQTGLEPRWALAPTPLAALALARCGQQVIVLARDRLLGMLSPLPLAALRWPAATIDRLDSVGVRTLGAALRLPRAGFARRFGHETLLALDRLTGAAPEPRRPFVPRERFRAQLEPAFELCSHATVLQHLEPLLAQLEQFLRARQSGIDLLMLRLQHRACPATRVDLRLACAELQAAQFATLLSLRLSRLELPAPVLRCELRSGSLQPLVSHSESIWRPGEYGGGAGRESPALIERLRARLGSEAVYGLCLVPEHRPESAWRVTEPGTRTPAAVPGCATDAGRATGAAWAALSRRPLWLLHTPETLPCALHDLQLVDGPERIETGWWDGGDVARDYYVARDAAGAELWVYRERLPPHGWYLHGVFG
jgi:protein ImuB